VADLVDGEIPE